MRRSSVVARGAVGGLVSPLCSVNLESIHARAARFCRTPGSTRRGRYGAVRCWYVALPDRNVRLILGGISLILRVCGGSMPFRRASSFAVAPSPPLDAPSRVKVLSG